jgi:3-hydroxyisobutyrate dehydrogenase
MQPVAFLGLGAIGEPMARHLAPPATQLTVWNRTVARAEAFAAACGATVASTPAAAASGADIVITCLPTSRDVELLLGAPAGDDASGGAARQVPAAEGLLAGLAPGSVLIDCTSGDPPTSRRIAARLADRGVAFLDAPVSGGVAGAVNGALTVMVGGDAATLQRVRPVLEMFGRKIVHCGPVGAGHALKAVNNALLASHIWSLAEGLLALERTGVERSVALDVINASSGRSNTSENLFPERVLTRAFPRTFRLALLDKDVRIAADLARDTAVPARLLPLTRELFHDAHAALGEVADHVEAVRYLEELAGAPSHRLGEVDNG